MRAVGGGGGGGKKKGGRESVSREGKGGSFQLTWTQLGFELTRIH